MIDLRQKSLLQGLTKAPSIVELELAAKKHRWKEMRNIQKNLFKSFAEQITAHETDILKDLKLPSIDEIRQAELEDAEETGRYRLVPDMETKIEKEFIEWQKELVGTDRDLPFNYYMLNAFALGLRKTKEQVDKQKAADDVSLDNEYLRQILINGGDRIKAELSLKHIKKIIEKLEQMARDGENPMRVGRWLHKEIGEGKAWWWNRIARSESALAIDGAFDAAIEEYNIPYEEWSAASTACLICAQFDGEVWRAGEGPHPVGDTHPHCLCVRYPKMVYNGEVRERWTRANPYNQPYTKPEIEAIEMFLGKSANKCLCHGG